MRKKRSSSKNLEKVLNIRRDPTEMFPASYDGQLAVTKDVEANRAREAPKLSALLKHIPDEQDLFPKDFDVSSVLNAVDRSLRNPVGTRFRLWLLTTCAEKLARGFPELAAQIMEKAAEYVRKRIDAPLSQDGWRNRMLAAADYWLLAGNLEERHEVLQRAIGLTMEGIQLHLWTKAQNDSALAPLSKYAQDMHDLGQSEEAAKSKEDLARALADLGDFERGTLCASLAAAYYEALRKWDEMSRLAQLALQYSEKCDECSLERFLACLEWSESLLYTKGREGAEESIKWLNTARDIADVNTEITAKNKQELMRWQGYAHRVYGEKMLEEWAQDSNDDALRLAERHLSLAVSYFDVLDEWQMRELAQCYALLSSILSAKGETERAEAYRDKAITLGLDLEDL